MGDWKFFADCWPDPGGMTSELQALGIEPMVTFWPFVTTAGLHFPQFNASGYLGTPAAVTANTTTPRPQSPGQHDCLCKGEIVYPSTPFSLLATLATSHPPVGGVCSSIPHTASLVLQ